MKIIEPSAKLVRGYEDKPEELIELCGRICYDSQDKIAPGTAQKFCERLKRSGHTSVFEHANIVLKVSNSTSIAVERIANSYERATRLPAFLRFDKIDGCRHKHHFVSGNVRAWNTVFDYTSKLYDSIPMCVIEALNAYPTLFDVEPWKKQANTYKIYNVRDPHGGKEYKANVIPPSQLPKWAYEQHTTATFLITCDRGISHELVRHRTASFSQQSTRYCKANKSGEIEIIKPSDGSVSAESLLDTLGDVNEAYNDALEVGISPQTARCVLPTCLATRLYMTMTLERWRDFLKLRTSPAAHPDMRVIAEQIQRQLFPDEIGGSNAD